MSQCKGCGRDFPDLDATHNPDGCMWCPAAPCKSCGEPDWKTCSCNVSVISPADLVELFGEAWS